MAEENALKHWLVPFAWDKTLLENGHAFYFGTEEVHKLPTKSTFRCILLDPPLTYLTTLVPNMKTGDSIGVYATEDI